MRLLALPLILSALAACTSYTTETDGPYYAQGHSDGCRTAEAQRSAFNTKTFEDQNLFEIEPSYRAGWRVGYRECKMLSGQGLRPTSEGSINSDL